MDLNTILINYMNLDHDNFNDEYPKTISQIRLITGPNR